jgi:glycosyltransferase involved in cell wall biosynthesis
VTPRVVVGVPLHDNVRYLPLALGSLLAQRFDAFAVVVVDDSTSAEPGRIVTERFGADPRVRYSRNPRHLGLVASWRRAFRLARELYPEASYFAWGSDHDVWEREWLAKLVAALDAYPRVVLAYPLNDRIDEDGASVRAPWRFRTEGTTGRTKRFVTTIRRMVPGDMVYGLFRADALAAAGVLRDVLLPDRLLVAELALQGEFIQVDRLHWHRRGIPRERGEAARQRARSEPFRGSALPWPIQHARAILESEGPAAAGLYVVLTPGFAAARAVHRRIWKTRTPSV